MRRPVFATRLSVAFYACAPLDLVFTLLLPVGVHLQIAPLLTSAHAVMWDGWRTEQASATREDRVHTARDKRVVRFVQI